MDAQTSTRIAHKIAELTRRVTPFGVRTANRSITVDVEGTAFTLLDNAADAYDELRREVLQESSWHDKFSESYIGRALDRVLAMLVRDNDSSIDGASRYFTSLADDFDQYIKRHTVYVALDGIRMVNDTPITMGRVILRRMSGSNYDELLGQVQATTIANTQYTVDENREIFENAARQLSVIKGAVCAEYEVVAEPVRAEERAKDEVRRIVDLFYYVIPYLYGPNFRVQIGLQGELQRSQRLTVAFGQEASSLHFATEILGPIIPFELSDDNMRIMEQIGIFKLSNILRKNRLTNKEMALLRSLHWFANAQTQLDREIKLISLFTCLESLLSPTGKPTRQSEVAEQVSRILTDDSEDRKSVEQRILLIYRKRSQLVHGRDVAILDADISYLTTVVLSILRSVIDDSRVLSSRESFHYSIQDQYLLLRPETSSASNVPPSGLPGNALT